MKILSKLIPVLIIIIPIILCITTLNKVWNEDDIDNLNEDIHGSGTVSGEQIIILDDNVSGESTNISGETTGQNETSKTGTPISKLIDSTVAISVANVYEEADETSKKVGTLEKHAEVIAQKYSNGWSRITNDTVSGWMKTENINFPEGGNLDTETGVKTGKVKADVLNMRASASTSAAIITTIPNGAEITIKEEVNGWYKVTYASSIGWVSADYVIVNK